MQDAAAMLSVSPSALRSWERRFGYPAPMRSAGGHRHYPHGEISALRDALEEGLSISSAIGRAREALVGTTPESLTRALLALDYERADTSMEAALALRTLDRAVEDVLLASLAEVGARTQLGSAPWALAAAWATQWLRRARRLCPEPWGLATILVGDATRELELDAVNVRALELLCIRAGASVLTLPVHALAGLPEVLRTIRPDVLVVAGSDADHDVVARWTYSVQRCLGGRPLLRYRRPGPAGASGYAGVLANTPTRAQQRLSELALERAPLELRAHTA